MIHSIEELSTVCKNEYVVPVTPNFQLIDAVVNGAIFQMTLFSIQKGYIAHLSEIVNAMVMATSEESKANCKMIFVLDKNVNYDNFKYVPGIGSIKQYKMIPEITATTKTR